jgi:hypothetical protein
VSLAQSSVPVTTNVLGELVLTNAFGDLNDDGAVNVLDVIRLNNHLSGAQPLSLLLVPRADLNQDGKVTETDRAILVDMILRLRVRADDDFDNDDLSNADEIRLGLNPFNPDMDGDGWPDGVEVADGTDPRNPNSHPSLTIIASPPVTVELPSAQATASGLSGLVLARPPIQIELVGTEAAAGAQGIVLARPPVQLELPGVEAAAGAGLVLAEPPVQIELVGAESGAGAQGTTLAQPPIQIELMGLEAGAAAQGPVLAQPPLQIELPGAEGFGLGGLPLFLAEPPIQINILLP